MLSFCGYTMCAGPHSLDSSVIPVDNISSVTIQNCLADKLFISKNPDQEYSKTIEYWNYDTVMIADFKNDLLAGNLAFALETVSSIRIKQREKGTFQWRTIYNIPIQKEEDLAFKRTYPYARSKTTYEFAVLPVLNNQVEGNVNITECYSEFDADYLVERDNIIQMMLNVQHEQTRNQQSDIITTLGRKYPVYVCSGNSNYDSGSFDATFIAFDSATCSYDMQNAHNYRNQIDDFLTNKKKKIYKTFYGDMWLINVVDSIPRSSNHHAAPIQTISWVETGDYNSTTDMYAANLLDVNYENL